MLGAINCLAVVLFNILQVRIHDRKNHRRNRRPALARLSRRGAGPDSRCGVESEHAQSHRGDGAEKRFFQRREPRRRDHPHESQRRDHGAGHRRHRLLPTLRRGGRRRHRRAARAHCRRLPRQLADDADLPAGVQIAQGSEGKDARHQQFRRDAGPGSAADAQAGWYRPGKGYQSACSRGPMRRA